MKNENFGVLLATLLIVILVGWLFHPPSLANESVPQDVEKFLEIERYTNEPLEIVEVKVREKSVKNDIKLKLRDNNTKWGIDTVKFKENKGWIKHLKIKVRNVSGQPIYGLRAGLDFKPQDQRILFRLPLVWAEELKRGPLQPGQEIDLEVDDYLLKRTEDRMISYAADTDTSEVSLSIDDAYFSDELMWSRGVFLRRDPNNRNKWDAVDKPAPPGALQQLPRSTRSG